MDPAALPDLVAFATGARLRPSGRVPAHGG
jgi:hypothetical protein